MAAKSKFNPNDLAVMKHMSREFVLFQVEENELDQLGAGYNSINLALFGISFGAFLTVGITWIVQAHSPTSLSIKETLVYFCSTLIFGAASVYLGLLARKDYSNSQKTIARIKSQSKPIIP
jgi:hypothetical protein